MHRRRVVGADFAVVAEVFGNARAAAQHEQGKRETESQLWRVTCALRRQAMAAQSASAAEGGKLSVGIFSFGDE